MIKISTGIQVDLNDRAFLRCEPVFKANGIDPSRIVMDPSNMIREYGMSSLGLNVSAYWMFNRNKK